MSEPFPLRMPSGPFKLTVDEYLELPNDGKRYQLLDGDLDVTPAPSPYHQKVSGRLQVLLMRALEDTGQGEIYNAPIDVILDQHTVVQPDLLFIRAERLHIVGPKNIQGAPDLVVEILSPFTRRTDVLVKSRLYASFGVPSYWLVDPDLDQLELFRLEGDAYVAAGTWRAPALVRPAEFPGLELPLDKLFG